MKCSESSETVHNILNADNTHFQQQSNIYIKAVKDDWYIQSVKNYAKLYLQFSFTFHYLAIRENTWKGTDNI
jgi:hypothetical protein